MTAFAKGDRVIRVPCPTGCQCDATMIPVGVEGTVGGQIIDGQAWKQAGARPGTSKHEWYYAVQYTHKGRLQNWWTFRHALELAGDPNFPDAIWVE